MNLTPERTAYPAYHAAYHAAADHAAKPTLTREHEL